MIRLGFTGSQFGMTDRQVYAVEEFLDKHSDEGFIGYHGDCVGSDESFDGLLRLSDGFRGMHIMPSNVRGKRAYCPNPRVVIAHNKLLGFRADADVVYAEKDPLARNEDIVRAIDLLLATPAQSKMIVRSGTWATVRLALELHKPVIAILPEGQMQIMMTA